MPVWFPPHVKTWLLRTKTQPKTFIHFWEVYKVVSLNNVLYFTGHNILNTFYHSYLVILNLPSDRRRPSPLPLFQLFSRSKTGHVRKEITKISRYFTWSSYWSSNIYTCTIIWQFKGLYLEKHILPGVDQRIKFCCKSSCNTTKGLNWIRDNLDYKIWNLGNISL